MAAVSVEKYGLEVPAAKITMRPFSKMPNGPAADVGLGHLVHLDGGHDARRDAGFSERILQCQRIDHGGQHAHVVRRHAIHIHGRRRDAAKEIAAAHHQPDLHAGLATSAISSARLFTRSGSMPKAPPPASTSPLSLRTMRWYLGMAGVLSEPRGLSGFGRSLLRGFFDQRRFAHFKADEARNRNVFAQFGDHGLDQVADGGGVFADEGLLVQANLFVEFVQPPFDDLVHHLLGLAFLQGPGALDVLSLSRASAVTSSLRMNCGSAAAICMARSFTRF